MNRDMFYKIDFTLLFIIFVLGCMSFISIYNAPLEPKSYAADFAFKQVGWYIFSAIIMILLMIMDYERLKRLHWFFYGFGMLLLFGLVLAKVGIPIPFATERNAAWGWYSLPGVLLQPAEFMKIFLIVTLSVIIDQHNENYAIRGFWEDVQLLGKITLVSVPPFAMVLIQPDLGSALIIISITVSMILICGISWRWIATVFGLITGGIALFFISWFKFPALIDLILESHQKDRFLAWMDPYRYENDIGYQVLTGLNSIGSGQFFNTRLDPSISIPESYTDFIFAVIGGTFGFVGSAAVVLLYFIMISRMIRTAIETHDPFGTYLCTGIIGMMMFQIFENIGMTVLLMPVTGITLPFLSYGGSSLLSSMMCIGLILSVRIRTEKFMFT